MNKRWEKVYADAMLETDEQKLGNRIDVAMAVLSDSLHEAAQSPQDMREKQAILDALRTLRLLQKELHVTTDGRIQLQSRSARGSSTVPLVYAEFFSTRNVSADLVARR